MEATSRIDAPAITVDTVSNEIVGTVNGWSVTAKASLHAAECGDAVRKSFATMTGLIRELLQANPELGATQHAADHADLNAVVYALCDAKTTKEKDSLRRLVGDALGGRTAGRKEREPLAATPESFARWLNARDVSPEELKALVEAVYIETAESWKAEKQ